MWSCDQCVIYRPEVVMLWLITSIIFISQRNPHFMFQLQTMCGSWKKRRGVKHDHKTVSTTRIMSNKAETSSLYPSKFKSSEILEKQFQLCQKPDACNFM